jgi:two-component system OmpR family response regulator
MSKILIVDDDPHIRQLVHHCLRSEGFEIVEAGDGAQAISLLETIKVDMVILDIMMPKFDGWTVCTEIRRYHDVPVLMLTAKGETSQKLKGFQLGADDYLVKPFEPLELVARVKALLKRYGIMTSQSVQAGALVLDRRAYHVTLRGKSQTIPLKEFELLFKLAGSPGRTFGRDQLIEAIWGYDFAGNERTLDVHINRLRERFPAADVGFRICTVRGLGYRLQVDA